MNLQKIIKELNNPTAIKKAAREAEFIVSIAEIKAQDSIRAYNQELKYSV